MSTPLTNLYTAILQSLDCIVGEGGQILYRPPGNNQEMTKVEVTVDEVKLPLIVPLGSVLKSADWTKCIGFHPTAECTYNSQSEVYNLLVGLVTTKLSSQLLEAAAEIVELAIDVDEDNLPILSYREIFEVKP